MPRIFERPLVIVTVVGVMVLAAAWLGLSRWKIKPMPSNLNAAIASLSANTNKTVTYPFSNISEAEMQNKQVRIKTKKGDIVFRLDPTAGPLAAKNFYYLVRRGFYDGITFHRVEDSFVIQGGDPTGTGRGGPGYSFPDDPVRQAYVDGTVAMANSGPNTNGSQFFICKGSLCQGLDPLYSIFGQVTSGLDVVRNITVGDVMEKVTIESAG